MWRRAPVLSVASSDGDGSALDVACAGGRSGRFDRILAFTGYRPDLSMVSELPVEISPATEGAAGIARALAGVTDCLSVPRVRPEDLRSGEPGFFFAGAKSYGRARNFLLRSGLEQLDTILDGLAANVS